MKRFSKFFATIILFVSLAIAGVDISPALGQLTVYAEQLSEVEEGTTDTVSSDDKSEDEAEAVSSDDKSEDEAEAVSSDDKSEDEAEADTSQQTSDSFNLDDKTGLVKEIEFSRPRKETTSETVEETVSETVSESVPETVEEIESHQTKGDSGNGGSTSYDNSVMNWINNPETVPVIEADFPTAASIPEEPLVPTEELTTVPRSVPKTGEDNTATALLLAGILCILSALAVSKIDDSVRIVFYNTEGAYKELSLSTVKGVLFAAWGTLTIWLLLMYVLPMGITYIRHLPLGLCITWEGNPLLMF